MTGIFLTELSEKIYEFRNNRIKENIGGIYDFLRKKKIENLKEIERKEIIVKEKLSLIMFQLTSKNTLKRRSMTET